jgi:glycosyltransferase involved in cell wall biosynthesis
LGRILRDIAALTHQHLSDIYDVASIGLGNPPSKSIPFMQYPTGMVQDWVVEGLPHAWRDHVGSKEGILFCIWDLSRLLWLAYPEQCPSEHVKEFLLNFKGKKWVYPAIDGCGPNGKLPGLLEDAASKFDRFLNYTNFSREITGYPDVCTHGIDVRTFYPRPDARSILKTFGVEMKEGEKLIGIVATNQPRKDWALAFETLRVLKDQGLKFRVWIHTDVPERHWSLPALYVDFGLQPEIQIFQTPFGLSDDYMAMLYSACDVTLGIGPEGVGYPILESIACGTPCVTGEYGGQKDFVHPTQQVYPIAYRYEGVFAIKRPVYDPKDFVAQIKYALQIPHKNIRPAWMWKDVWPAWEKWLRAGVQ